jgi:uncharacterized tellurite resistance protein B-like protein
MSPLRLGPPFRSAKPLPDVARSAGIGSVLRGSKGRTGSAELPGAPRTACYDHLMSLLDRLLGHHGVGPRGSPGSEGETETVRKIVRELDALPRERARWVAAFAFILSRVANADLEITDSETRAMERILVERAHLPEEQAVLAVQIAKSQNRLFGGTENFLVTREFKEIASREERLELLSCLFAVAAADGSIASGEEAVIRQIASELALTSAEFDAARAPYSAQREILRSRQKPSPG